MHACRPAHNKALLVPLPSMAGCTSGLVRYSFFGPRSPKETQLAGVAQYDVIPEDGSGIPIVAVDVASLGNCHNFVCFDVHHCAARWKRKGRFAIAFSDDLRRSADPATAGQARGARNLGDTAAMRRRLDVARTHGIDMVVIVPDDAVADHPLTASEEAFFKGHGIVVRKVPWLVPPSMRHTLNRGCGFMDFIRLHALNLTE